MKILLVEDSDMVAKVLIYSLKQNGYDVIHKTTEKETITFLKENSVNLVILDISLPDGNGFDIYENVIKEKKIPTVFLTAKDEEDDIVRGLESGADDYMTKPFSPKILLAKANALLRRSSSVPLDALSFGKITVVPSSHKVFIDGQEITLTHKEYELLYFFMVNPGQIFTRDQLLNRIWGYDFEGTTRTVDTHIKTLRQKLGDEGKHIVTLIRSGYKFEVTV